MISHLVILSMEILVTPSHDRRDSEMELRSMVHIFWCIDGQDLFVISYLADPLMGVLVTPSCDRQNSEMEIYGSSDLSPCVLFIQRSLIKS
jgi:hypothetical protein